jgi:hypothetical protein
VLSSQSSESKKVQKMREQGVEDEVKGIEDEELILFYFVFLVQLQIKSNE